MNETYPVLEISISDRQVEIWYKMKRYAAISINSDNRLAIAVQRFEEIEWSEEHMIPDAKKMDVYTLIREIPKDSVVAIPQLKREPARTREVKARRSEKKVSGSEKVDRFDEQTKDKIVQFVLDFYLANGRKPTAVEVVFKLRFNDEDKMPVAGVLANLTRGTYGTFDSLLASRRKAVAARKTAR